ncbi:radical SAM protein [Bacteroidota bacterium]
MINKLVNKDIDSIDRLLLSIPLVNKYYSKNAAKIKKNYYLSLHHLNILKPNFVLWLSTYACNLKCPFCEANAGKESVDELTTNDAKNLIDELKNMKTRRLVISGGEPLIRKDIFEIMEYANTKNIEIGLLSNGVNVKKHWDKLKNIKYFFFLTSIDGTKKYHDGIRELNNSFDAALESLEFFKSIKVPTRMIKTVVTPGNIDDIENIYNVIKSSAATRWEVSPVSVVGRAAENDKFSLNSRQLQFLINFINNTKTEFPADISESHSYLGCFQDWPIGKPFFCGAGLTRCAIMPNGEILGCNQIYDLNKSEGNIKNEKLSYIWKNNFKSFRNNSKNKICNECKFWNSCQGGCWAELENKESCLKSIWFDYQNSINNSNSYY